MLQLKFSNMEKYRIGSDIDIYWVIRSTGSDLGPLDNYRLRLFYTCYKGRYEVTDFSHDSFTLSWKFKASEQKVLGDYTLTVEIYSKGGEYIVSQDYCGAFSLVGRSCEETIRRSLVAGGVTDTLMLASEIAVVRALPVIPEIGANGNWWIEGTDTGKRAEDKFEVGPNGNWLLNGEDTGLFAPLMHDITYQELKALRDAGQLQPGEEYRIVDYVTRDNGVADSFVAGEHLFDIIVKADTESSLSEEARVCKSRRRRLMCKESHKSLKEDWIPVILYEDTVFAYHESADPITASDHYKCEVERTGEIFYTQENSFSKEDFVMRYLYDGELLRNADPYYYFAAEDSSQLTVSDKLKNVSAWKIWYCLDNDKERFSWANAESGRGVIYRMIDENGNDVAYDFKSIKFWNASKQKYQYTFEDVFGDEVSNKCKNNKIGTWVPNEYNPRELGRVFLDSGCVGNTIEPNIDECYLGLNCINNRVGVNSRKITLGFGSSSNRVGKNSSDVKIGFDSQSCIIGDDIFYCVIGDESINVVVGDHCQLLSFGNNLANVKVGIDCDTVVLGDSCKEILIGANCQDIRMGINNSYIKVGSECSYIDFRKGSGGDADNLRDISIGNRVHHVLFNKDGSSGIMGGISIDDGICGTEQNPYYVTRILWDSEFYETPVNVRVSYNTKGQIVQYCLADLIKVQ